MGASLTGFEPATRCLEGSCSVQLSYRDAVQGHPLTAKTILTTHD